MSIKRAPYQYERRVLKCQLHSVLLALDVHCAVRTRQRADGSDMAVGSKRTVIRDMFLPRLLAPPPLLPPPREAVVWSIAMVALSPRCDVTVEEEEEEAKVARGGPWPRRYAPAPRAHATRPNRLRESALGNAQLSGVQNRLQMVLSMCAGENREQSRDGVERVCRLGVGGGWSPSSLSPEVDRLPRSRARAAPSLGRKGCAAGICRGSSASSSSRSSGQARTVSIRRLPVPRRKKSTREAQRLWSMSQSQR